MLGQATQEIRAWAVSVIKQTVVCPALIQGQVTGTGTEVQWLSQCCALNLPRMVLEKMQGGFASWVKLDPIICGALY